MADKTSSTINPIPKKGVQRLQNNFGMITGEKDVKAKSMKKVGAKCPFIKAWYLQIKTTNPDATKEYEIEGRYN